MIRHARAPHHDYARHGITSLFAAFNTAEGTVIGELHRLHCAAEFRKFLARIDKAAPASTCISLRPDLPGSISSPLTGRWFGYLTDQKLRRGAYKSVQVLEKDIRAWIANWNTHPRPFIWTKTAEEILESLARYCRRISDAGH